MKLLRKPVENKLSSLLGARVTLGGLNASLLKGTLEANDLVIADDATSDPTPVLSVGRIRAEASLLGALRKEIVVKSLVIERPAIDFVQDERGRLNLPRRVPAQVDEAETPDSDDADEVQAWRLDLQRLLIVDASIRFRSRWGRWKGYEVACDRALAELKRQSGGYGFTTIAESPRRVDRPATLGDVKANGHLTGVDDLARVAEAVLDAEVELGSALRLNVRRASMAAEKSVEADVSGSLNVPDLLALLPRMLLPEIFDSVTGRATLAASASYSPPRGLRVSRINFTAEDVAVATQPPRAGSTG